MFDPARRQASSEPAPDHRLARAGLDAARAARPGRPATAVQAQPHRRRRWRERPRVLAAALLGSVLACSAIAFTPAAALAHAFPGFKRLSLLGSTVPANGDENPYGVADVTATTGSLVAGNVLVSNFNDSANLQGTGTTIVQLTPRGRSSLFARLSPTNLPGPCPGGVGLTTALAVLPQGYVVVGSLPTTNGMAATAQAGCLIVLDSSGRPVETISGPPINGPWDMTAVNTPDGSTLFVSNVLNGTVASGETPIDEGTVVRIRLHMGPHTPPAVKAIDVIAEGLPERTDTAALVVGPTGVAVGDEGTLYVADTQGNRIAAVRDAMTRHMPALGGGTTVAQGGFLNGPLGLAIAPDGDILTADAGDGNIVETLPDGAELQPFDTGAGAGGLFGLAVTPDLRGVYFVNDTENTLELLR